MALYKKNKGFTHELDSEQIEAYEKSIQFRGEFITEMVDVETGLNMCLIAFFDGFNSKKGKIHAFLQHFLLFNERFPLKLKQEALKQIVGFELYELEKSVFVKAEKLINTLEKLVELRNTVAHYPLDLKVNNDFGFIKPKAKFLFHQDMKNPHAGAWTMSKKSIVINEKVKTTILLQLIDVRNFILLLSNMIQTRTGSKDYYNYLKSISDLLKPKTDNYLSKEGVFQVV